MLAQDLDSLDTVKEASLVHRNLMIRHGQMQEPNQGAFDSNILGKRKGDEIDRYGQSLEEIGAASSAGALNVAQDMGFALKRARMGEKFENFDEFFELDQI